MTRSTVMGVLIGVFTGILVILLACIACLGIAFATGGTAEIPGFFSATMASAPNGTPQLRFVPNGTGIGVTYLVWVAACTAIVVLLGRSRASRRVATSTD